MLKDAKMLLRRYLPIGCILIFLSACTFGLPSDKTLVKRFDQNRQDFERLAKIFESLESIGTQPLSQPEDFQKAKLQNKSAKLLDKLDIQSASENSRIGERLGVVYLEVAWGSSGMAFSWAEKGYAYRLEKPEDMVSSPFRTAENLDSYNRELSGGQKIMFRPIDKNWYLYFFRGQD